MSFITFGIALALSLLLIPLVRRLAIRTGRVARPREDRWSRKPTALLGGLGIFGAFGLALLATLPFYAASHLIRWPVLVGLGLVFLLGIVDDFKHISPQAKLVGQILASAVVVSLGYTTTFFTPRIANPLLAQIPNVLLTFFWLVGITNAINLLDNMDGLAGGISLITALFLSYFFWQAGSIGLLLISMALAGSLLGFLVYNFPPAKIFMGDSGSLFLGFTLAVLAIARQPQASNVFAVLGVPTLLFLLPILDTTLVTFTRLLRGQSPAQGGRDHTSHRLIAFGLSERQAVLALYSMAILSGLMAATLESLQYWFSLVLVPILVISLALLMAYLGGLKVVAPPSPGALDKKPITRIMLELTFRRRLLEVALDFFLIGIAWYLAFLGHYGLNLDTARLSLYLKSLPVALSGSYLAFFLFGVYRGMWRYISVDDLVRYLGAVLAAVTLSAAGLVLVLREGLTSPEIYIFFGVFLLLGMAGSRLSFKVLDRFSGQQSHPQGERVLIYGAEDSGEMALRWIMMNPKLDYRTVGFLDEDPYLAGRQIHGVEVLGSLEQLGDLLEQHQIDGLILAAEPSGQDGMQRKILQICSEHGCWVRSLRLEFELVEA